MGNHSHRRLPGFTQPIARPKLWYSRHKSTRSVHTIVQNKTSLEEQNKNIEQGYVEDNRKSTKQQTMSKETAGLGKSVWQHLPVTI